jgi:hypothetical protein
VSLLASRLDTKSCTGCNRYRAERFGEHDASTIRPERTTNHRVSRSTNRGVKIRERYLGSFRPIHTRMPEPLSHHTTPHICDICRGEGLRLGDRIWGLKVPLWGGSPMPYVRELCECLRSRIVLASRADRVSRLCRVGPVNRWCTGTAQVQWGRETVVLACGPSLHMSTCPQVKCPAPPTGGHYVPRNQSHALLSAKEAA